VFIAGAQAYTQEVDARVIGRNLMRNAGICTVPERSQSAHRCSNSRRIPIAGTLSGPCGRSPMRAAALVMEMTRDYPAGLQQGDIRVVRACRVFLNTVLPPRGV
jgi:hypothetical protein